MLLATRCILPQSIITNFARRLVNTMANNQQFKLDRLFNVDGWVAVVTGGGTGIGLMCAQALANNGARVYITGRRENVLQQTVKTHGSSLAHPRGELIPLTLDATNKASIQQLVAELSKCEKHVDLLVNNAGISKGTSTVEKGDETVDELSKELFGESDEDWVDVYRTNVMGFFITSAAFALLLSAASKARPHHTGSIINISIGCRNAVNIRVNNIAPGIFPSEMTTGESDETNKSEIPVDESYGEKKGIPAGRPGRDEDIAQAVLLLACNGYAYGQTLAIEGGYLLEHP